MKIKTILVLSALSVLLMGMGSKEKASNEFVFAVDATWPPMEMMNTDTNEIEGFTIDLVNAIAEAEGFKASFVNTAWDGIFAGLANGDYDGITSSVTITEERKENMLFSDPYFKSGLLLAMNKEFASGVNGLDDLAGKPIGVQTGTSSDTFLQENYPDVDIKSFPVLGPAVEELANGTLHGIVSDIAYVNQYMLKESKHKDKFVVVGGDMQAEEYGFAFPKTEAGQALLAKFNSGLKKVKGDGTLDKITSKWINE